MSLIYGGIACIVLYIKLRKGDQKIGPECAYKGI